MKTMYAPDLLLGTAVRLLAEDLPDPLKGARVPFLTMGQSESPFQWPVWPQSAQVLRLLSMVVARPEAFVLPRPLAPVLPEPLMTPLEVRPDLPEEEDLPVLPDPL